MEERDKAELLLSCVFASLVLCLYVWYLNDPPGCVTPKDDICHWSHSWTSYIGPCKVGGQKIGHLQELNHTVLARNSILVITIPIPNNVRVVHPLIIYTGYAKQFYFPNMPKDCDYVYLTREQHYLKPVPWEHCWEFGLVKRDYNRDLVLIRGQTEPHNTCIF